MAKVIISPKSLTGKESYGGNFLISRVIITILGQTITKLGFSGRGVFWELSLFC